MLLTLQYLPVCNPNNSFLVANHLKLDFPHAQPPLWIFWIIGFAIWLFRNWAARSNSFGNRSVYDAMKQNCVEDILVHLIRRCLQELQLLDSEVNFLIPFHAFSLGSLYDLLMHLISLRIWFF